MADYPNSFSSVTPLPPRVTSIEYGVFQIPTIPSEPVSTAVPAGYRLFVADTAPTTSEGSSGDWYFWPSDYKIFRKTSPSSWSLVSDWEPPPVPGTVTSVGLSMPAGFSVAGSPVTSSGTLAVTTSLNGILRGNGSGFTTAVAGVDYAGPTSGSSILYGNGAGGFSNVTIGSNLTFVGGVLSATAGGDIGTVTTVSVVTANGISGSVANATTTPAITLTLGAITPASVNGVTFSGSGSFVNSGSSSLTGFTGSGTSSGTNTGDQNAAGVPYSNTTSGLTATDVQAGVDELAARLPVTPFIAYAKNLPVGTSGAPADIGTITVTLPPGVTRYAVGILPSGPGSTTPSLAVVESASGSGISTTLQVRTASGGGGSSVGDFTTMVNRPAGGITGFRPASAIFTATTLYVRQSTDSGETGTVSTYLLIIPLP